jgi:hypothetical protein
MGLKNMNGMTATDFALLFASEGSTSIPESTNVSLAINTGRIVSHAAPPSTSVSMKILAKEATSMILRN